MHELARWRSIGEDLEEEVEVYNRESQLVSTRAGPELCNAYWRALFRARRAKVIERCYTILHDLSEYNRLLEPAASPNDIHWMPTTFPIETLDQLEQVEQRTFQNAWLGLLRRKGRCLVWSWTRETSIATTETEKEEGRSTHPHPTCSLHKLKWRKMWRTQGALHHQTNDLHGRCLWWTLITPSSIQCTYRRVESFTYYLKNGRVQGCQKALQSLKKTASGYVVITAEAKRSTLYSSAGSHLYRFSLENARKILANALTV